MTIREYIGQKFSAYGTLTDADVLDFSIHTGLTPDDEAGMDNMAEIEIGMIYLIPSIIARTPDSVNESGFSISWDKDGLRQFYLYLCGKNDVTPEVMSGLGIVSSYTDY